MHGHQGCRSRERTRDAGAHGHQGRRGREHGRRSAQAQGPPVEGAHEGTQPGGERRHRSARALGPLVEGARGHQGCRGGSTDTGVHGHQGRRWNERMGPRANKGGSADTGAWRSNRGRTTLATEVGDRARRWIGEWRRTGERRQTWA